MGIFCGVLAGSFMAYILYRLLFNTKQDFMECVRYWFTPDILSMIKGNYFEDSWAELKLLLWAVPSIAVGYGVYGMF